MEEQTKTADRFRETKKLKSIFEFKDDPNAPQEVSLSERLRIRANEPPKEIICKYCGRIDIDDGSKFGKKHFCDMKYHIEDLKRKCSDCESKCLEFDRAVKIGIKMDWLT